jgi:CO/xanthine dehydrogenase Mo-binding subunit
MSELAASRRAVLQGLGAVIVAFEAGPVLAQAAGGRLDPARLESWIAVGPDGVVSACFGKIDVGQGVDVAIAQIVADELDVPVAKVEVIAGDTSWTLNQGGVSGSTGIQRGAVALRNAAAEARRILVERAAAELGAPAESLTIADGTISAGGRHVTYAGLVARGALEAPLEWNGQYGNGLVATGRARPKAPDQYRVVGQPVARRDVPAKVLGAAEYVVDHRLPGMLHGRMIRPPVAGASPVDVDMGSVADIPGVKVVRKGDFIGLVAPREWDAVRAARALKVTWSQASPPFPDQAQLYDWIRKAPVAQQEITGSEGAVDAAVARGARLIEAEYEWPFQSHASLGPACAVADVRAEGATVWTGSQKPHATRDGVAGVLGLPPEKVRAIALPATGSYGRNDAGDAAIDAAVLSREAGAPVRVQYMRNEGTGWDPKAPASVHRARAALGSDGKILAYEFVSKGFSRFEAGFSEADASDSLAGMLLGLPFKPKYGFGGPEEAYQIPARRVGWEVVASFPARASPLRTTHMRDPVGPQTHFASECFIDELAAAAGKDPVAFRLSHLTAPRDFAVIKTVAEKAHWIARPAGPSRERRTSVIEGRGVAYAGRGGTFVAVVAEIEVERSTGRIWPRRILVAHDCGLIVNPLGLRGCIEGNVVQGISRALFEEVRFDRNTVTSVDWAGYPILDITDAPETVEIDLINRPEIAPSGAGEPTTRLMAAAIGNALYDATGVRVRRAPLSPERIKAVLA